MTQLTKKGKSSLPSLAIGNTELPVVISNAGERATYRYVEFFTAQIRNPNTRRAYLGSTTQFFEWLQENNLAIEDVHSIHVATYIEILQQSDLSAPSVKQHLAAIRMLFDWLVTGHIIETNPATSVKGPKYVAKQGKTPILTPEETRQLFDSIPTNTLIGLRDRAFIAVMVYTFGRVTAVSSMKVNDYYPQGKRWWVRLHEKGGKRHEMPAHHTLEQYLDEYLDAAGIRDQPKTPLFRTFSGGRKHVMTENPMQQTYGWQMIQRRAREAGIDTKACNHTFRGTGITTYLSNNGTLEKAQQMAAHESPRTTKLYDRTNDAMSLDEIEKIII
ncbi:integrase [Leucothrix sargassi]|nr:integrase [Leucothrix sargassi]